MSYFTQKYNRTRKFNVDTTNFNYESLVDLYNDNGKDAIYPLTAVYINTKSKFGEAPIFASVSFFVNAPSYMLDITRNILEDENAIADINAGKVGFKIYVYKNERFNRDCFGIAFVDIH